MVARPDVSRAMTSGASGGGGPSKADGSSTEDFVAAGDPAAALCLASTLAATMRPPSRPIANARPLMLIREGQYSVEMTRQPLDGGRRQGFLQPLAVLPL